MKNRRKGGQKASPAEGRVSILVAETLTGLIYHRSAGTKHLNAQMFPIIYGCKTKCCTIKVLFVRKLAFCDPRPSYCINNIEPSNSSKYCFLLAKFAFCSSHQVIADVKMNRHF